MVVVMVDGTPVNVDVESLRQLEPQTQLGPGLTAEDLLRRAAAEEGPPEGPPVAISGPRTPEVAALLNVERLPVDVEALRRRTFPTEEGADLRDAVGAGVGALGPGIVGITVLIALLRRVAPSLVGRVIAWARRFAVGGRIGWDAMPGWLRQVLTLLGFVVGTEIVIDALPGTRGEGLIPGFGLPDVTGPPGVAVVGSWEANNVRFYRLADGRLAVQNKMGRWKVWRPKRPIVLMPTGANSLQAMLRADAVLNRQAKRLAAMLARRGGARVRRSRAEPVRAVLVSPAQHAIVGS